ncbi:hypothetical protein FHS16_003581 [Paenibacillus endophyticus]|uniref:Uncharacterized protein n=1 Tax=Paenibacillus endophyticus TaxID=1294268 RepID=A0A7W5GAQ9_9BACL|nr:hypothetical protein [Paenibacillus endophyticus]MBB3153519.1 hypothetical protein [Paenibacillus endophyticus]
MEWEKGLSAYVGRKVEIWIEDHSGEEQTKPKPYPPLFRVKLAEDGKFITFYLKPTQFLSVPIFDGSATKLENTCARHHFVSHDIEGKLTYWIYFEDIPAA